MALRRKSYYVRETAEVLLNRLQCLILYGLAVSIIGCLVWKPHITEISLIAACIALYVVIVAHRAVINLSSALYKAPEINIEELEPDDLKTYSIIIAMRHEGSAIIERSIKAISNLNYPPELMDVIYVVDDDDGDTIAAFRQLPSPPYFRLVIAPMIGPGTKPRALNYAFSQTANEITVPYDIEDVPHPDQLLEAVATFKVSGRNIGYLQARLVYSPGKKWYNCFYKVDYAHHFWELLRGMAGLGLAFPLGGTSNHFRTEVLREVGVDQTNSKTWAVWDSYNVAEDADLGLVLQRHGYKGLPLNSFTIEESPDHLFGPGGASRQRQRWLKGYLQTGLVHSRHPLFAIRQVGLVNYLSYMLVVMGTPIVLLINPIFWSMTIYYIFTESSVIQQLFPAPLYYSGMAVMIFGNLGLFYQLLVACYRTEDWKSVPTMFLVPFWWAFNSLVSLLMFIEIIRPSTRYRWNKTSHGHSLIEEAIAK